MRVRVVPNGCRTLALRICEIHAQLFAAGSSDLLDRQVLVARPGGNREIQSRHGDERSEKKQHKLFPFTLVFPVKPHIDWHVSHLSYEKEVVGHVRH